MDIKEIEKQIMPIIFQKIGEVAAEKGMSAVQDAMSYLGEIADAIKASTDKHSPETVTISAGIVKHIIDVTCKKPAP
jgi:hypothetical protein